MDYIWNTIGTAECMKPYHVERIAIESYDTGIWRFSLNSIICFCFFHSIDEQFSIDQLCIAISLLLFKFVYALFFIEIGKVIVHMCFSVEYELSYSMRHILGTKDSLHLAVSQMYLHYRIARKHSFIRFNNSRFCFFLRSAFLSRRINRRPNISLQRFQWLLSPACFLSVFPWHWSYQHALLFSFFFIVLSSSIPVILKHSNI